MTKRLVLAMVCAAVFLTCVSAADAHYMDKREQIDQDVAETKVKNEDFFERDERSANFDR
jgi:opacity protein-like surface antigen